MILIFGFSEKLKCFSFDFSRILPAAPVFLLFLVPRLAYGFTFLSPLFEKLSLDEMLPLHSSLTSVGKVDSIRELDVALLEFFVAEAYYRDGKIHEASFWMNKVNLRCESHEQNGFSSIESSVTFRYANLCALVVLEKLDFSSNIRRIFLLSRFKRLLIFIGRSSLPQEERWYVDGRMFTRLPLGFGRDVGKGLMALEFLKRAHPDGVAPLFFQGEIHLSQGRTDHAGLLFKQALAKNPQDKRIHPVFSDEGFINLQDFLDGLDYGWDFGLTHSSSGGIGLRLGWFDDRIFDQNRSMDVSLEGTTRKNLGLMFGVIDRTLLNQAQINLSFVYKQKKSDFLALGMVSSSPTDILPYASGAWEASLSVKQVFMRNFFLSLGWQASEWVLFQSDSPAFNALDIVDRTSSFHMGAFAELAFDSRDSVFDPLEGAFLGGKGYFPTKGMGSERTFEKWTVDGWRGFSFRDRNFLSFQMQMVHLAGQAPFGAYPYLGESGFVSSLGKDRYVARNLLALELRFRKSLWDTMHFIGFVNTASLAETWSSLYRLPWGFGTGGGLLFQFSRFRRRFFKVEAGVFASEIFLYMDAGASW